MNAEEARSIIRGLNASLSDTGMGWVAQEVSAVVERGIEERKKVALETFDETGTPVKRRGPKIEVTGTRPFTDMEELELLIASVRAAVIDTNEIQEKALLGLKTKEGDRPQVSFQPDIPEDLEGKGYSVRKSSRGQAFELTVDAVEARKKLISQLRDLIAQLEEIIHAD